MSFVRSVDPAAAKNHWIATWSDGVLKDVRPIAVTCTRYVVGPSDIIVIEDQYPGLNMKSVMGLCKAAGHLVAALDRSIDQVVWVQPRDWKYKLCGGSAPKPKGGLGAFPSYSVHRQNLGRLSDESMVVYNEAVARVTALAEATDLADCVGLGIVYHDG